MKELKLYVFKNKNGKLEWSTCGEHEDIAWSAAANMFHRSVSQLVNEGHSIEEWTATRDPERFYND